MLTPADIENKEFKKEMRGYNMTEVNIFLKEVAMSYEKIYQENLSAMDRIGMLSDAVKQYKSMEDTLKNALSVAKGAGDEIKNSAHGQAQMIIKDAENKAGKIINEAAKEVADINYKYEEMKRSVEVFKAKVVSLLNSQLEIIKEYSNINADTDREIRSSAEAVEVIKSEINDIPDLPGDLSRDAESNLMSQLEKVTQELPRIKLNEDGEYVPADENLINKILIFKVRAVLRNAGQSLT